MRLPAMFVCLSVSKITHKRVHGYWWHIACRQVSGRGRTDQLLSPIRIIVRMPEPDYFLRYRMHCNTWNFITSRKSHVQVLRAWLFATRGSSDAWFWLLRRWKTTVGGKCALPSAVLVLQMQQIKNTMFSNNKWYCHTVQQCSQKIRRQCWLGWHCWLWINSGAYAWPWL